MNLSAYYYSFEPTGDKDIDAILEAVAKAGKSFHSTEDWADSHEWVNDGVSFQDLIQCAANDAAGKRAENE